MSSTRSGDATCLNWGGSVTTTTSSPSNSQLGPCGSERPRLAQSVQCTNDLFGTLAGRVHPRVDFDVVRAVAVNEIEMSSSVADCPIATLPFALLDDVEWNLDADEPDAHPLESFQIALEVHRVINHIIENDVIPLTRHCSDRTVHAPNQAVEDVAGMQDKIRTGRAVASLDAQSLYCWVTCGRVEGNEPLGNHRPKRVDAGTEEWSGEYRLQLGRHRCFPRAGYPVQEDNLSFDHPTSLRQRLCVVKPTNTEDSTNRAGVASDRRAPPRRRELERVKAERWGRPCSSRACTRQARSREVWRPAKRQGGHDLGSLSDREIGAKHDGRGSGDDDVESERVADVM